MNNKIDGYDLLCDEAKKLFDIYNFNRLPVEGTFMKNTYVSSEKNADGNPVATAMVGMYTENPLSLSCFHKLKQDEIWHFYGGDPFTLYLLYDDGTNEEVLMGNNIFEGERNQFVVPANTWQAGSINTGGRYSFYGCTLAPGWTNSSFEAAIAEELIKKYPDKSDIIKRFDINHGETKMPDDYRD